MRASSHLQGDGPGDAGCDPKRIIEIRRLLNRGMLVSYIADDIRINQKTASIQCDPTEGHWRVGFGMLTKIVDV